MKWILRFSYFTANIVKFIHIVMYPKTKKEPKQSLAAWESNHINECSSIRQALKALRLGILVAKKFIYLLEEV